MAKQESSGAAQPPFRSPSAAAPTTRLAPDQTALSSGASGGPDAAALPEDLFPNYQLLREIHRGGQGVVYQAVQKSTTRTVAIKVMREGPFAGAADRTRFEREVQILGQLNHPNIVGILDSGVAGGSFYFVMDYVAGRTLDEWILEFGFWNLDSRTPAARGGAPTAPPQAKIQTPKSKIEAALRLFMKICDAVNAAHLRGVIHRDLKPGNIRVDERGEPHILDFGLAKVTPATSPATNPESNPTVDPQADPATGRNPETIPKIDVQKEPAARAGTGSTVIQGIRSTNMAAMTQTGEFIGSLPWAAPEQAEGSPHKIDLRTDVYALGVVLYQMLTGNFPYVVAGNLRDVLNNILLTEPIRPSSFQPRINDEIETIVLKCLQKERDRRYQTAGELARDIRHYLAGEPIEAKRDSLGYLLRKQFRKHRAAVAVAAGFLLIILAGLLTSLTLWRQAERQRAQAEANAKIAQQKEARAQAETAKAEAVKDFFQEMLASADPLMPSGRSDATVWEAIASAVRKIEAGALQKQPEVEAAVRAALGRVHVDRGLFPEAEQHLTRALELRRAALGNEHRDVAQSLFYLGNLRRMQDRPAEAEPLLREAIAMYRRASNELRLDDRLALASALNDLALTLQTRGQVQEAESLLCESIALRRELLKENYPYLALDLANLASLLNDLNRPREAEALYREALAKSRADGDAPDTVAAYVMGYLGDLLQTQKRFDEAEPLLREALAVQRRLLDPHHPLLVVALNNLGQLLLLQNKYDAAEPLFREALESWQSINGPAHPATLRLLQSLVYSLEKQGKHADGETLLLAHYRLLVTGTEPAAAEKQPGSAATREQGNPANLSNDMAKSEDAEASTSGTWLLVQQNLTNQIVVFYEDWNTAAPGQGHADQATMWRAKLKELQMTTQPASSAPAGESP